MAAISEYENVPASDSSPAATHTKRTIFALPTLQVITRVFRNTPVPIMLATFTAMAAQGPMPRTSSVRAEDAGDPVEAEIWVLIPGSIGEMQDDYPRIWPYVIAGLAVLLIYRRFRRSFGRQPMSPARMWIRIALLILLGCSLLP